MDTNVTFILPFSNEDILKNWFLKSPIKDEEIIKLEISKNKSAPILINEILDDLKKKQWLVFCEEWVRFLKKINPLLKDKNKQVVYGITGARILKDENKFQVFDGRTGYQMIDDKLVDSLGQGCLVIHSSLLKKFDLKFDEEFKDRYMVDFSLQCKTKGIKVGIIALNSRFKERIIRYGKEHIFRKKLRQKYSKFLPIGLWGGTLTNDPKQDLMTFLNQREDWIETLFKEKSQLLSKVTEYEKTFSDFLGTEELSKNFQKWDSQKSAEIQKKLYDKLETKLVWIFWNSSKWKHLAGT